MRLSLTVLAATSLATPTLAADLRFCWIGANGYSLSGLMEVPDQKMSNAVITEKDVTAFRISGFYQDVPIGNWDMRERTADTTFHVRFDPNAMEFLTGGSFASTNSQGWNADGNVMNCGNPGFGFNSGNYAQDICVNGKYIEASSIAPSTPLVAQIGPDVPTCSPAQLMGKARIKAHIKD